jgi:SAM-dependent methyltransferase
MPEPSWAEGYVVDVGYTHGYFRELAPTALRFAALLGGLRAIEAGRPFTYYELGCGNGRSTALHAACNPHGRFYGIDFNPLHVRNAREFAQSAGLANAQYLEHSFAELQGLDLPEADFVALHGVYSWVSEENRRHIVDFIRRRLAPGGLVYLSYNCLPGLAQVTPLQRLLTAQGEAGAGALPARVKRAIEFAHRLEAAGADYFRGNPLAAQRLKAMDAQNPSYVAHEYFNASWNPMYHADVARELAEAKLSYAASATTVDNFDQFVLRPELVKLLAEAGDRTMAETLRDYARNRVFRRDVFARGAPEADGAAREALLGATRFALARPRSLCRLEANLPAGHVKLQAEVYDPVLDALAQGPATFDELARAPQAAAIERARLRQVVFGLAAFGHVAPALPAEGEAERRASTERYNDAVLAGAVQATDGAMLASPVLGSGVPAGYLDLLLLAARRPETEAVEHACEAIASAGKKLFRNGKPIEGESAARGAVAARAKEFFTDVQPFMGYAGVSAPAIT